LLLAFLAGWTQRDPRRAALLGLACTMSALLGYALMTLSPVENAHLSVQSLTAFARSQNVVIAGGFLTGPLFGWLGNRWRNDQLWPGALALAALICLEPLAHAYAGDAIRARFVWLAEVVVGLAMAVYVATTAVAARRRARSWLPQPGGTKSEG
jgi:hypothetical protein